MMLLALLWDIQPTLNASLDWSVLEVVLKDLLTEPTWCLKAKAGRSPTIFFSIGKASHGCVG